MYKSEICHWLPVYTVRYGKRFALKNKEKTASLVDVSAELN